MKSWFVEAPLGQNVYDDGNTVKEDDIVFFMDDCDEEYIIENLINHDGYNPNIKLKFLCWN